MEGGTSDSDEVALSPLLTKRLPEFKAITAIITCAICYGSVKNPLTTAVEGCGHTFCSLCVRGYLAKFKQQCPQCFKELHDSNLLINRPLNSITQYVITLIPKLEALIQNSQLKINASSNEDISEVSDSSIGQDNDKTITATAEVRVKKEPLKEINDQQTSSSITDHCSNDDNQPSDSVTCPVCQISILQRNVNVHLDACLGNKKSYVPIDTKSECRENNLPNGRPSSVVQNSFFGSGISKAAPKPAKINKVVYFLLKDPDLRKLLKKEGLDLQGDRKTLINRHQRFTILWNSQCDSDNPLTRSQIINKLRREEQNLSEASTSSPSTSSLLNYDRNTNPDIIETKQKAYIQKNQSHFDKLIQQLKARKREKDLNNDNQESKKQKLNREETKEDDLLEVSVHSSRITSSQRFEELTNDVSKPSGIVTFKSPVGIQNRSLREDILPLESEKESSEVTQKTGPLKSSTPKCNRLNRENDTYLLESSIDKPMILSSESDFDEQSVTDGDKNNETTTTKRKSKLSLSKRYGAGSTKKTHCPVCQELIRESLINFHLDHCLGQQTNSNCEASRVVTRARIASKVEKQITSATNLPPHKEDSHPSTNSIRSKVQVKLDTSKELFSDNSEDELNFPLSQLHNPQNSDDKVNKTLLTKQSSQISRISSTDTFTLLNITPEIIEASNETDDINFSELIKDNLENSSTTLTPKVINSQIESMKEPNNKKMNLSSIHDKKLSSEPADELKSSASIQRSTDRLDEENNLCKTRLARKRTTRASSAALRTAKK